MDRRGRPFVCLEQSCNKHAFPDKGTLQRHQYSVHTKPRISCPVKSCRRRTRGFALDNLRENIKRAHPTDLLKINETVQRLGNSPPGMFIGKEPLRGFMEDIPDGDCSMEETAKTVSDES